MCLPVDQPDEGPDQGTQLEITEAVERDLLTRHVSGGNILFTACSSSISS